LLENVLFADLDCRFGGCSRVAHVIETPATGSRSRADTNEPKR
jgi:hypothetical protein